MSKQHGLLETRRVVAEYKGYYLGSTSDLTEVLLEITDSGAEDWNAHRALNLDARAGAEVWQAIDARQQFHWNPSDNC
ncbi:MAG TPA: hypothetical protein VK843_13845 [Planctomycetota bacterium]|nr:hypothetical protein [Planctomycetota bacterium]